MPDLRQLRAFVAVAEELNFTRAAERVHLAQQAVSKSVAQLERELGVDLLRRTTREVTLTPAGLSLLESGRKVLADAEKAFDDARSVGAGLLGTVRIGVTPAIGPGERSRVVAAFREGEADVSVSIHEVRPREIGPLLRERAYDLILSRTWGGDPQIESAALSPTAAVLFVSSRHPLAERESVRVSDLDGERLLAWSRPGTPFTDLLLARISAAGATVETVEARVIGSDAPLELDRSDAVALLPEDWPVAPGLKRLPFSETFTLPLLVLWPAGASAPVERVRATMGSTDA